MCKTLALDKQKALEAVLTHFDRRRDDPASNKTKQQRRGNLHVCSERKRYSVMQWESLTGTAENVRAVAYCTLRFFMPRARAWALESRQLTNDCVRIPFAGKRSTSCSIFNQQSVRTYLVWQRTNQVVIRCKQIREFGSKIARRLYQNVANKWSLLGNITNNVIRIHSSRTFVWVLTRFSQFKIWSRLVFVQLNLCSQRLI